MTVFPSAELETAEKVPSGREAPQLKWHWAEDCLLKKNGKPSRKIGKSSFEKDHAYPTFWWGKEKK